MHPLVSVYLSAALLAGNQQADRIQITVSHREPVDVADQVHSVRGRCDGREIVATVRRDPAGRDGRITLRFGRLSRDVPSDFLGRRLLQGGVRWFGLACDGTSAYLVARAVEFSETGAALYRQMAILNRRTGHLRLTDLRRLSDEEARLDVR